MVVNEKLCLPSRNVKSLARQASWTTQSRVNQERKNRYRRAKAHPMSCSVMCIALNPKVRSSKKVAENRVSLSTCLPSGVGRRPSQTTTDAALV